MRDKEVEHATWTHGWIKGVGIVIRPEGPWHDVMDQIDPNSKPSKNDFHNPGHGRTGIKGVQGNSHGRWIPKDVRLHPLVLEVQESRQHLLSTQYFRTLTQAFQHTFSTILRSIPLGSQTEGHGWRRPAKNRDEWGGYGNLGSRSAESKGWPTPPFGPGGCKEGGQRLLVGPHMIPQSFIHKEFDTPYWLFANCLFLEPLRCSGYYLPVSWSGLR